MKIKNNGSRRVKNAAKNKKNNSSKETNKSRKKRTTKFLHRQLSSKVTDVEELLDES